MTIYRTLIAMATINTRNTFALSKSLDFRFLTFGDSSKKTSEPRAKPRPSKGVSCLLFGVEVTVEVVDGGILLRLRSLSCALSKSEADIRGCFSSSGFSENRGNNSIYTNHKRKTMKFDVVGETICYRVYPYQLNKKRVKKKLYHLKSQPIFTKASQTEWCEPYYFPTGISGFSM